MTQETATVSQPFVMDTAFWTATTIFLLAYALIVSEKIHKTIIAIFGAGLMLVLKILHQHEAFHVEEFGIDWNVIFLLISMMIMINLMRPTGVFEYIAIKSAKWGGGEPFRIMAIFAVVTAVLSAFLDNVTTVLLITPVTLLIADALEVDPIPYLISCALASNIGGTATLIGDPPNIMIASKAQLNFMDFIYHLTPIVVVIMVFYILVIKLIWGKNLKTRDELKQRIMAMDENEAIKDPVMLKKSLSVLAIVLTGFVFHGVLHFQPATVALFGAGLLLLLSKTHEPHHILAEVEWPTIFFFIGLFIIVGGVVKVGLIKWMSVQILELTHGNLFATSMVIMWFSAFASAIVDNIPYVATMNPLIIDMAKQLWPHESGIQLLQHPDLMPLWWSLALGACLGGNGSAIGASANVIVVGMSEKAGRRISFMKFMAYGMPIMIMTIIVSTIYICFRYYVLKI
ncbi:arsenical pump family protein [Dissulfurispira thermophila]|uniref:Arsenical pump family protein n=1 Tax=Dissulfurispira thermophila TaxID=2715679 RepID=A0A7G1H3W3_9BACT|nr:ArsB/NhaD family transporter [Dissulfurispira thermophila]BCB96859.1 arsenical pump family protein [Dissulfurispira thermophila]